MYHHRMFSASSALVIGIIGLIGLLIALAQPAAAQPNIDWPASVQDADLDIENVPAIVQSIKSALAPIDLPATQWQSSAPPTRSLSFRRNVSSPYQDSFRSSTSSALTIDAPRSSRTEQNLTDPFAAKDSRAPLAPLSAPMPGPADLAICLDTDRVWGVVSAGDAITVAVNNQQMGASTADAIGFFWTTLYNSAGDRPGLITGDNVAIYHGTSAGVTLRSIDGQMNLQSDIISGTIGAVSTPMSVTVYIAWSEPSSLYYSQTISTDASGNFSANFSSIWNLTSEDVAVVGYIENGIEVHKHIYPARSLMVRAPWKVVRGFATPNSTVTVSLILSDAISLKEQVTATASNSAFNLNLGGWRTGFATDINESDIVVAQFADGLVFSRTVDLLTINTDPVNDRLTGQAKPSALIVGTVEDLTSAGWRTKLLTTTATASGYYTINFSGIANIMPGRWGGVYVPDAEGDDLSLYNNSPSIEINQTYNEVNGTGNFMPMESTGQPVTLTLYSSAADIESSYVSKLDSRNQYGFTGKNGFTLPDIIPGDVVTVENGGWVGVVDVMTITVQRDLDLDQFTGTIEPPTDRVELSVWNGNSQLFPLNGWLDTLTTANSPFTATLTGFDLRLNQNYDVNHRTTNDYINRFSRETGSVAVFPTWNVVLANVLEPGIPYTITLRDSSDNFKAELTNVSQEPTGFSGWYDFWSTGQSIGAGDHVQVQSAAGFSQSVVVPELAIFPDMANDTMHGIGPANSLVFVNVDNQGDGYVPIDSSGNFSVALSQLQEFLGSGHLTWGDSFNVNYFDQSNNVVINNFSWPYIDPTYFMDGSNQVNGWTPFPVNPIYITVTHPVSGVIATATATAGSCDWCGPNDYNQPFPDGTIVPGNFVTVDFGGGYVDTVEVVALTGYADPVTDILTGTAPANSVLDIGTGRDKDWTQANSIAVDASGYYTVDFAVLGWDLRYGDQFKINYRAPHGHNVTYIMDLPAPDLSISKWNPGGYARLGGVVVYAIQYSNWGNGNAENTIITDTLPLFTTYAGDTSGVTPEIGSEGIVTWNLGTLTPGTNRAFMVTLNMTDSVGTPSGSKTIPPNCAGIGTSSPGDSNLDDNSSCADWIDVWDDEVEIGVDKWANLSDPTPGQEFEYTLQICNNRGAAAGPIWLTDTLPLSTTLVDWRPQNQNNNYWNEISRSNGRLVLYAPGLSGNTCDQLQLRLLLDPAVPLFTRLTNSIAITVDGDVDLNNNARINTDARTSSPRYDLNLNKSLDGQLVPGGQMNVHLNYQNQGNSAIHAWVTDTLPTGTSYQPGSAYEWNGGPSFPPASINGTTVVWDLGTIGVNQNYGLDFSINISSTITPGTILTNCATIGLAAPDDTPWDNISCAAETINHHGPNLRVIKYGRWEEKDYRRLYYDAQFQNIGDQQIDNVWITDTLPLSTTLNWWKMDFDWGRISSQIENSDQLALEFSTLYPGDNGWLHFEAGLVDPDTRPRWYTNTIEISTPVSDATPLDNLAQVANLNAEVNRVELRVGSNRIEMWGQAQPNSELMVATASTVITTWIDNWGNWNINQDGSSIEAGDTVTVTAGDATMPVVIHVPAPFDVQADSNTNQVWGQIDSLDHQLIEVALYDYLDKNAQTDSSGNFVRAFPDVPRGGNGEVRYRTTIDYANVVFHRDYQSPDLLMTVNYSDNWVEGNYEPGHTVWLTATHSDGVTIKGTAVLTTGLVPWWGGQTGYSTNWQGWSGSQPDLMPGDWVYGSTESGYTSTVHIGTINGNLDTANDRITGTVVVAWFTDLLNANCWVDGTNDTNQDFTVDPNGGSYACDFSPYDLVPGSSVSMQYEEPDGDWVRNTFRVPSANMWVSKWRDGNGDVAPGGSVVYAIQYGNSGDAAGDAILTDTLPANTTYVTDSSDFPVYVSSGVITWNLGTVLPSSVPHLFYLVLNNSASAGDLLHNVIDIGTAYDQDWNNNHAEADVNVSAGQPDLYIKKDSQPGDPTSGQLFRYNLQYGNNGSVASGPVWLTDTLPVSTTFVSWQSQNGYSLWTPIITDGEQIVFYAPSIPGKWGDQIFLTLELDDAVAWGTQLTNTIEITTTDDANPDDNTFVNNWTWVKGPRYNVNVHKQSGAGTLVPNGQFSYWIDFSNNGNTIAHDGFLTDTLPSHTTFITAYRDIGWGIRVPFLPTSIVGDQAFWNLGDLPVNDSDGFHIEVQIDPATSVGTILANCVTIGISDLEDDPYDNMDCVTETVRNAGTNLRVTKFAQWQDQNRIQYQVRIENIGTTTINNVNVTDTLPISASLNWWNFNFWQQWSGNAFGNQITLTLDRLEPNWTTWLNAEIQLPSAPNGTFFTNTVEMTTPPDDVNPADNMAVNVLGTGPDLLIEKWLTGGTPRPGQLLTYTLHFKNDSQWWTNGSVWITDVLPIGTKFVSALQRLCGPANYFCQHDPGNNDGSTLAWDNGQLGNGWWNDLIVTVRVTDTAKFGDVLTNTAQIASDDPANDIEPNIANNLSTIAVSIINPKFDVSKEYQGNRVAGTVVTYTLTVTNQGNLTGTNARLIDWTPSWFTYGGGGSYSAGLVTWTIPLIAPNNGTATRWFSGTLSCTANTIVTNQDYRVSSSDQGVTSTDGLSVSFLIAAPTITASIIHSPSPILVSGTARFTATANTDGTPLSYAWNFGDGSNANGLTASHVYTQAGIYTAIFTATDACNFTRVQTSTITISAPTINANFDQSAANVVVSSTVRFTDTSTTNVPPIAKWEWDFGDGTAHVFTQNATHAFLSAGIRTIKLIVTDTLGYSASHTNTVTVNAPTINANFTQSATTIVVNTSVRFTDTSTTSGPPITAWLWNFGDGGISAVRHPTHTYTIVGNYTVTLLITDSLGYTATRSVINAVSVQPACTPLTNVTFTFTPIKPLIHTSVAFTATIVPVGATTPISYAWSFGDGSVVTTTVPTIQHAYHVSGTKTINLETYNLCTSIDVSAQQSITIDLYRVFLPLAMKNR